MRYVLAVIGVFFPVGLVSGMPVDVLIVISVFALLAGAALVGARSNNRVRSLRQAVFFTDTLISYRENLPEEPGEARTESDQQGRTP